MQSSNKGFTLIEVMIVVVIVGILTSIAYPSYQRYVLREHRAEGQALLNDMAARQERYRSQRNTYTSNLSDLFTQAELNKLAYYTPSIVSASATAYSLQATAKASQTRDTNCTPLTLNETGAQGPTPDCWK